MWIREKAAASATVMYEGQDVKYWGGQPRRSIFAMACGVGVCMTCVLPVVGDDGVTRMLRSCVDGPVFRGDRVRWDDVGTVPADTYGAPTGGGH